MELRKCRDCSEEKSLRKNFHKKVRPIGDWYSSQCKCCEAKAQKQRRNANLVEARAKSRAYEAENRPKINTRGRAWRLRHVGEVRCRAIQRRQSSEKIKRQTKVASTRWRLKNPEQHRLFTKRQRAIRRHARVERITTKQIDDLYVKQQGRCAACRKTLIEFHRDHIKPLSKGGAHAIWNLQLLCPPCNLHKHADDPIDFMQKLGFLL